MDEWIISVIRSMYEDATTLVKLSGGVSKRFNVKVGVHQSSVLSPLLFIIILEALSRNFKVGLLMELFYADDLVLLAGTKEELVQKINTWKTGMEEKGLQVNVGKSKVMRCRNRTCQAENSGTFPCGICKKGSWNKLNPVHCLQLTDT